MYEESKKAAAAERDAAVEAAHTKFREHPASQLMQVIIKLECKADTAELLHAAIRSAFECGFNAGAGEVAARLMPALLGKIVASLSEDEAATAACSYAH